MSEIKINYNILYVFKIILIFLLFNIMLYF